MPARIFLVAYNYLYPPIGFPLFWWLFARAGGWRFAALALGIPLVFGYLMPGIGTNLLKQWRFRGPWLWGNYFAHHGFIYASTMAAGLWVSAFPAEAPWSIWAVALRSAACVGFVGWAHDLIAARRGMVEIYNPPWKRGACPEAVVAHYAPICFPLLGGAYGAFCAWGREVLGHHPDALWGLLPAGVALLAAAGGIPYHFLERE